jgi:hypothetical protein
MKRINRGLIFVLTNKVHYNHYLNKESEYLKMFNSIDNDIDLINGVIQSNTNESYKPILNLENSDKSNYLYLLIKVFLLKLTS